MSRHDIITNLMLRLVERVGDDLGIEFRSGTDKKSQPYKTNDKARNALFSWLAEMEKEINEGAESIERTAVNEFRSKLKELMEIES